MKGIKKYLNHIFIDGLSVLTALFCARSIERIGDRCQNICEFIFYYVKGQDFRHVGGDELDKLLAGKDSDK